MRARKPIGVFDSGLGGLSIIREVRKILPRESIAYFGDLAHLPYGIKSTEQIRQFSLQNADFLVRLGVKLLVVACNSSSSAAFKWLQRRVPVPVVDVIQPVVREAAKVTRTGRIAVIGTSATIESGAYPRALLELNRRFQITVQPCPLFVPLVEEGWRHDRIAESVVKKYLIPVKNKRPDVLILGCTHYPLLKPMIRKVLGPGIRLLDAVKPATEEIKSTLIRLGLQTGQRGDGKMHIYLSDRPRNFIRVGEQFLGEKLTHVHQVHLS
ncbi:MAG: glutamate racemase [Omnitrophica bacterium GWA2_52_8]|nr:MAG: glutamate racemase [Omnitrophica bacterium GWA2_52_8]